MLSICIPHRKSLQPCSPLWRSTCHLILTTSRFLFHLRPFLIEVFFLPLWRSTCYITSTVSRFLFHLNPFFVQLFYFSFVSLLGFLFLKAMIPRSSVLPNNLDLFFMSVSSATVSSMSTIDMELFSNSQFIVIIFLMLLGGEVFLSMIGLCFSTSRLRNAYKTKGGGAESPNPSSGNDLNLEMVIVKKVFELERSQNEHETESHRAQVLKYNSLKFLLAIVGSYITVFHLFGVASVLAYMSVDTTAREALEKKGINMPLYAVFMVVSSFGSCGFTPNNENMFLFRKNSGLLLIIMPHILLGNTLYAPSLRFLIWILGKFAKRNELEYLMNTGVKEIGYSHLLPILHSKFLPVTVIGFIGVQMLLFTAMEWNLPGTSGLNGYQKLVAALFQCVNSRHAGESVLNIANMAPATLVLFIAMMYLPPYTSFLPPRYDQRRGPQADDGKQMSKGRQIIDDVILSHIGYLVIFIIVICITERESMMKDPLNFNVLHISLEVVSAYGNVGFSAGYNCQSRLNQEGICEDKGYGFAGRWSNQGKIILIIVMLYGRLKKFNKHGGKAWKIP